MRGTAARRFHLLRKSGSCGRGCRIKIGLRLGRKFSPRKILNAKDWSNVDDSAKISAFAVKRDTSALIAMMGKTGKGGTPDAQECRT